MDFRLEGDLQKNVLLDPNPRSPRSCHQALLVVPHVRLKRRGERAHESPLKASLFSLVY